MYETGNEEKDLRKQVESLALSVAELTAEVKKLNDTAMGTFVQLSRLYDITAAKNAGASNDSIVNLLDMHEDGHIYTSPPVLKSFNEGEGEDA